MPEFDIVKTSNAIIRGVTQEDETAWQRLKKTLTKLEAGEFVHMKWHRPRNVRRHRMFMAMVRLAFDHWEPAKARKRLTYKGQPIEKDFEQFRKDVTIQAGFYSAFYDGRGRVRLEAKSINFDAMEDDEFERVYRAVQQVLLERVLTNYTGEDLDRVVEELQRFGSNNG